MPGGVIEEGRGSNTNHRRERHGLSQCVWVCGDELPFDSYFPLRFPPSLQCDSPCRPTVGYRKPFNKYAHTRQRMVTCTMHRWVGGGLGSLWVDSLPFVLSRPSQSHGEREQSTMTHATKNRPELDNKKGGSKMKDRGNKNKYLR